MENTVTLKLFSNNHLNENKSNITKIFKSNDFLLNIEELLNKYPNEKEELKNLKKIEREIILNKCKLLPRMMDYRGNNYVNDWTIGEKRGGEKYTPPTGWIGFGLNVKDKYDAGNNAWLGNNNSEGEWCVAYHGVGRGADANQVANTNRAIITHGFRQGQNQINTNDNDLRHPGNKCGEGIYCTPDIEIAENYAGIIDLDDEKYKCVLMLRVDPKKIRQPESREDIYILNPSCDEIRPYRILLKKC